MLICSYSKGVDTLQAAAAAIPSAVDHANALACSSFILDHGDRSMFSQAGLCGTNMSLSVLPFVKPRDSNICLENMCAYVSREMEKYAMQ